MTNPTVTPKYNHSTFNTDLTGAAMTFTSTYAAEIGAPATWVPNQFHWHAGSEHTVDDVRYDIEFHTVNLMEAGQTANGFAAAAMGVIFDRTRYSSSVTDEQVAAIDAFFDSIYYDDDLANDTVAGQGEPVIPAPSLVK